MRALNECRWDQHTYDVDLYCKWEMWASNSMSHWNKIQVNFLIWLWCPHSNEVTFKWWWMNEIYCELYCKSRMEFIWLGQIASFYLPSELLMLLQLFYTVTIPFYYSGVWIWIKRVVNNLLYNSLVLYSFIWSQTFNREVTSTMYPYNMFVWFNIWNLTHVTWSKSTFHLVCHYVFDKIK